jgi:zinc protease
MRRFGVVFVLVMAVVLCAGEGSAAPGDAGPRRITLENGVTVVLDPGRNVPVAALQVWVKVGSADESEEEAGLCHFVEHMAFKGTARRKAGEMAKEVESVGGVVNAFTSYENTVYHVVLPSRHLEAGVELLADAVLNASFDPFELEKERQVILEEIRMGQDQPSRRLIRQTLAALYSKHPYRRPVIGYEKTVKAVTRETMDAFYRRHYTPDRMVFVAAGDFDAEGMERLVRERFGGSPAGRSARPPRQPEPVRSIPGKIVSDGQYRETYLQVAFPAVPAGDPDEASLDALAHLAGGGESSRLVRSVRLEQKLVNSISATSFGLRDSGVFMIEATLDADRLEKALEAILREVVRLAEEDVPREDLDRFRILAESRSVYERQTVQGRARKQGYVETLMGDLDFERRYLLQVAGLSPKDLSLAARRYLDPSRMVVSVLLPSGKTDSASFSLDGLAGRLKPDPTAPAREPRQTLSKVVLENGIRVVVKEDRSVPIVTFQAAFQGGVRYENPDRNGVSHFTALMMTKGTLSSGSMEIAKRVERMAGSLSSFSGYNSFGLTLTVLSRHADEALALLRELLLEPAFDPAEMEKRRPAVLASLRQQEDQLDRTVFRLFYRTLYENHPYRMDPVGTRETVEGLTPETLRAFHAGSVVPENFVLAVAGDVDPDRFPEAVAKAFGSMRGGPFHPASFPPSAPFPPRQAVVHRDKEQAHFVLGFPGVTLAHADRYPLEVLGATLTGMSGRLFRELRDKESLAYSLAFIVQPNLDPGWLGLYMATAPVKAGHAVKRAREELRKVVEEGLSEEEVTRARRYLQGTFEIGLQTIQAQASQIASDELYGLGADHHQHYVEKIGQVTEEDVRRVAKTYLSTESWVLAVVRPPGEKKE